MPLKIKKKSCSTNDFLTFLVVKMTIFIIQFVFNVEIKRNCLKICVELIKEVIKFAQNASKTPKKNAAQK